MNNYQIMMNVKDICLLIEGKPKLMGYFQTFNIEAESPEQAELQAVEKIRQDEEIKSILLQDKQAYPPRIYAEQISEVDDFDEAILGDKTGKAFYPVKQWWQFWK